MVVFYKLLHIQNFAFPTLYWVGQNGFELQVTISFEKCNQFTRYQILFDISNVGSEILIKYERYSRYSLLKCYGFFLDSLTSCTNSTIPLVEFRGQKIKHNLWHAFHFWKINNVVLIERNKDHHDQKIPWENSA